MKRSKNQSSLLSKYTLMYEKKPRSRVFAPLAESYRKLGMHKEAINILNQGIKNHPTYTLGYVVLSHCYYDLQNYEMAYNIIRPFVSQNLENIKLQKIFGNTCMQLGFLEEALQTFKYLLLLNPKDVKVAEQIKLLEDDLLVNMTEEVTEAKQEKDFDANEDDWVQVDFHKSHQDLASSTETSSNLDDWSVGSRSPLDNFKHEVKNDQIEVKEHTLDDNYYHEDFDNDSVSPILPNKDKAIEEDKGPIITHTLVDLYCKQGHFAQAASILENILELHPDDQFTQKKLDEIALLMVKGITEEVVSGSNSEENKLENLESIFNEYHSKLISISQSKLSQL